MKDTKLTDNSCKKLHELFKFADSYTTSLPDIFYRKCTPEYYPKLELVIFNHALSKELGIKVEELPTKSLAKLLTGQTTTEATALAYAGHQFGHFVILGDGRAHLLGEHIAPSGARFDIHLKGSGRTPYARRGDGRAALGPMLREYLISEAMHAFGIPTTRSLAVCTTGEAVPRQDLLTGAILTRIASSHIRVGTFEYASFMSHEVPDATKLLTDYTISRHYPELSEKPGKYLEFFKAVMTRQIKLITEWLRVGFIHGVMNTDNVAISGETIDYGPCAFMNEYDPATTFSSIDRAGRYAFGNQANITLWNLGCFAKTLLPLMSLDETAELTEEILPSFKKAFEAHWRAMMFRKLGLIINAEEVAKDTNQITNSKSDELINSLLTWMHENRADYTLTFRYLTKLLDRKISENETSFSSQEASSLEDKLYAPYKLERFQDFTKKWLTLLLPLLGPDTERLKSSLKTMQRANPVLIPRNFRVEKALADAENGDLAEFNRLLEVVQKPYDEPAEYREYLRPPEDGERVRATYCGT